VIQKPPGGGEPAPVPPAADALWESEYLSGLLGAAAEVLKTEFPAAEWKAFWAATVEGKAAVEVARELNITPASVPIAEARVLRQLRQELAGLLD
jgi:DNA-directed RNA polymerase specialized sigma24 family protein